MGRKVRKSGKLVQGWGVNDVEYNITRNENINGKSKQVWVCPYYEDWGRILKACFNKKYQEGNPTYIGCTICEDWKCLSNFIRWVDNQPNKDWINCEVDKDFIFRGNKHYSPETCIYITAGVNCFITDSKRGRGNYMIGVTRVGCRTKRNPYQAACNNPFTGKQEYLGVFPTEYEAHLAWQAKKHQHACNIADLQPDSRVGDILRGRYAPDKDWTKV